MDLKDIKAIIDLMKKNSLTEFELEKQDFKIKLKRGPTAQALAPGEDSEMNSSAAARLANSAPPSINQATLPAPAATAGETEVKSPMIGTFYRAPSPDAAPYVDVGAEVAPDTVVCVIEAMKVMNEIKAEVRGIITEMVAENGKPVEFGQPLFKVRPL